ncbi:MAG: LAGLIDADG family homing endonuclease [Candidatus Zambryskibacteria bacterium]|nr:LAGLIDADG family homing endonuclease [Candidatus Zambryskibacteria bacterium]
MLEPKKTGSQLRHSIAFFHKNNARRTKPGKLSADYIVGLTDGEGSFTVFLQAPKKEHGSINYRVLCRYYIKMREDDLPLLKKVEQFWGCGKIYFQREYRENQHNNYRFEIFNYDSLRYVVVPFFKRHPLESKRIKDFELFCQILDLAMSKAHQTEDGLQKIMKLKSQMHAYLGLA